jgi:hypothetical protein
VIAQWLVVGLGLTVGPACTVERAVDEAPARRAETALADPHRVAPPEPNVAAPVDAAAALREAVRPEALVDAGPLPEAPALLPRRAVGLELQEAGAEPRQTLARHPTPGTRQAVTLTLGMKVAMHLGRQAVPPAPVPAIAVDVDVTTDRVDPDGVHYSFRVADVRVGDVAEASERLQKAVLEAAVALTKLAGTGTLGTDGTGPDFQLPAGADENLTPTLDGFRDSFAQLLVTLPTEPLGVGATWRVVGDTDVSGLPAQRVTTYTLRAFEGTRARLDVSFEEHGVVGGSAADSAAKIRARAHLAQGTGEVTVDPALVLPAAGAVVSNATTHAEVALGAQPQAVVMQLGVDARVTPRGP